jgi:hypothetical protein
MFSISGVGTPNWFVYVSLLGSEFYSACPLATSLSPTRAISQVGWFDRLSCPTGFRSSCIHTALTWITHPCQEWLLVLASQCCSGGFAGRLTFASDGRRIKGQPAGSIGSFCPPAARECVKITRSQTQVGCFGINSVWEGTWSAHQCLPKPHQCHHRPHQCHPKPHQWPPKPHQCRPRLHHRLPKAHHCRPRPHQSSPRRHHRPPKPPHRRPKPHQCPPTRHQWPGRPQQCLGRRWQCRHRPRRCRDARLPGVLWSAVTRHRFPQATRRRRSTEGSG